MTISQIFDSVDLTEVQKQKIDEAYATAVEKAVNEKVAELEAEKEAYKQELIESIEQSNQEYLAEHVHPYFEDVAKTAVKEFIAEHKEKFENVAGTALHTDLISEMKQILEKHNVVAPEAELQVEKLAEANSRINTLMAEMREKDAEIETMVKTSIVEKTTAQLTESQKDKISDDLMALVFVSEEQFTKACTRMVEAVEPEQKPSTITENKEPKQKIQWTFN